MTEDEKYIAETFFTVIQSVYFNCISGSMTARQSTIVSKTMLDAGIREVFVMSSYNLKDDWYTPEYIRPTMTQALYPNFTMNYDPEKKMSFISGNLRGYGYSIDVCRLYPNYDVDQIFKELTIRKS